MRIALRLSKENNDKLWRCAFANGFRGSSEFTRHLIDKDIKKPLRKLPKIPANGLLDHNTSLLIEKKHMDHLIEQKDHFEINFATEYLRILIMNVIKNFTI